MRKYPAYSDLRVQYKDEPLPEAVFPAFGRDEQDRFVSSEQPRGRAPLLPDLQVRVCTDCNSGWMAQLEEQAERILKPWIKGSPTRQMLSRQDQRTLGAWVMKTAAAYSLYLPHHLQPFSQRQLGDLVGAVAPPGQCLMWIAFSDDESAHVAAQLIPFWFGTAQAATPETVPSAGSFYLGVHGVVFLTHFWQGPEVMGRALALPRQFRRDVQRVWPPRRHIKGPKRRIGSQQLSDMRRYLPALVASIGINAEGLTKKEAELLFEDFMRGDP